MLQLEAGFLSLSTLYLLLAVASPCLCLSYACARIWSGPTACVGSGVGGGSGGGGGSGRRLGAADRGGSYGKQRASVESTESPLDTPPTSPPPVGPPLGAPSLDDALHVWESAGDPCRQRTLVALLNVILVAILYVHALPIHRTY